MNNKSYLIVDDDQIFGNKLCESLKTRGIKAFTANNILNANEIINHNSIDRVILDLKLDQENGLDFLIDQNNKNLEVVILTGYGSVNTVKLALKRGAVNYIQKPASIDDIIKSFEANIEETAMTSQTTLNEIEADHINRVLLEQNGNISKTAKILGLHRRSLQRKLKKSL